MTKKIVILGGGTGGLVAALDLAEAKKRYDLDIDVTLVNKDEWHYTPPLWIDVAVEGMPLEKTRAPIKNLEKYGVNVVVKEATAIDPDNRKVMLADGSRLEYDYLFVSLGLRNGWEAYPGLAEAGYHNYDPQGAMELNKALFSFTGGKIIILVPETPFRSEVYPLEVATVLGYKLNTLGIKADITILSPRLPGNADLTYSLGPDIKRLWDKYLARFGIKVKKHEGLESVDPERKVVVTKNFEESYDLLIKVPPPRPPRILENDKFLFSQDKRFTVARPIDFRHPEYDDIFMTGEHSMPPTGLGAVSVFAREASDKAARVLINELGGAGEIHEIHPVACVAYSGDKGWLGVCEVTFDGQKYNWRKCYNVIESFLAKMIKRGFYQGWLDRLRF